MYWSGREKKYQLPLDFSNSRMNIVIFRETAKRIVRADITTKTIVRKKWNHENTLSKRRKERKATKNRWDK